MSAITGIGDVTRDKRTTHTLAPIQMSYAMIAQLWAKEAMCAKAIEKPGEECFRPGFELDIPGEQTGGKGGDSGKGDAFTDLKEYVTDQLRELDVVAKLKKAYQYKRAYGGGALLLGINDGRRLDQPVDTTKNPSLDWINVLEPIEIFPISFYDDPAQANYGEPEFYQLGAYAALPQFMGPIQEPKLNVFIHESRIIPFRGIKVSRYFFDNTVIDPYWGASLLPRFYDAMRDCAVAYSGAGLLSVDVSQPVITIEGLRALVGRNEEALRARMIALEQGRSIARAILLDGKEKYERQTTQLAGIPDLLDRCAQFLAANIDIPLSILFGYSPASLGTPDNQELTQWYNLCRVIQTQEFTPPLRRIIDLIMRGRRSRGLPKRYDIAWGDLEHMTTTQRVQNEFTQARTDSLNVKSGTIYPDEIRKSRWVGGHSFTTQINENKPAPGFMAPLPTGVIAKADPATGVINAAEAKLVAGATGAANGNAAAGPPAGAHTVGGYTRRNPVRTGGEKQPGTGSGPEARASKADEAPGITAVGEVQHLHDRLAHARSTGTATPGVEAMFQKLLAITQAEAEQCAAGTCGPDCIYSHEAMDVAMGETITYAGFPVLVENPKGSVRHWVDSDGTTGSTTMKWDYGEIPGSLG
ncbi:MAG TPA: anti-CBASS Acb1 family protein, partial [Gammaproteobacteria bacterium]|nr:anti-CBASS Acb1 family protein [Gammaproteobacteria bacterium]